MKNLNKRADGRIEWVCPHGVGHTIHAPSDGKWAYVHGCDGCCANRDVYRILEELRLDNITNVMVGFNEV